MRNRALTTIVRASCRVYAFLLPLYRSTVRWQFGAEMAYAFEQQVSEECAQHGFAGLARAWFDIILDITESRLPGEIGWRSALVPALSLVCSFALFVLFFSVNGHCIK